MTFTVALTRSEDTNLQTDKLDVGGIPLAPSLWREGQGEGFLPDWRVRDLVSGLPMQLRQE